MALPIHPHGRLPGTVGKLDGADLIIQTAAATAAAAPPTMTTRPITTLPLRTQAGFTSGSARTRRPWSWDRTSQPPATSDHLAGVHGSVVHDPLGRTEWSLHDWRLPHGQQCSIIATHANRTMIGAFTARPIVFVGRKPTPQTPQRLPRHVRYRCATPRRGRACKG